MKVLHIIARMNVGGTARYLSMLSKGLEAHGIESAIATGFVQGAEAEDPSVNSAKLYRINHLGRAINPIADRRAMQEIAQLINTEKPDIVHSHTFKAGLLVRAQSKKLLKQNPNLKFVHTFHGHLLDDPEFSGNKKSAIIFLERSMAKRTHKIITVGQRVADELLQNEIGYPGQFVNIPPGVTALPEINQHDAKKALGIETSKPIIGWLARVTGVKNPFLAMEIAEALPQFHFIFGGQGDLFDQLKAKELANTSILGWVDAATFISACDVILSTSENEGMPVALIEAQLAGKPVVATKVGSVAEVIIDGETGFVTDKNKFDLILKLEALLNDPRLITEMGQSAKKAANKAFSPSTMVQKHIDLYKAL